MYSIVPAGLIFALGLVAGTAVQAQADRTEAERACTKQGNVEVCINQNGPVSGSDVSSADTAQSGQPGDAPDPDQTGPDTFDLDQADIDRTSLGEPDPGSSWSGEIDTSSSWSDQAEIETPAGESDFESLTDELLNERSGNQTGLGSTPGVQWQAPRASDAAEARVDITVDQLSQKMTVDVDGVRQFTWKVSTGKEGYWTPKGEYTPMRMEADYFSREWDNAPMPHSIFFTHRGHAIHGSRHTGRLGSPASHGCVRLSPENAATLFALVAQEGMENTSVKILHEIPVTSASAPTRREVRAQETGSRARGSDAKAGSFWLRGRSW